jgi:hypothetical protein
MLLHLHTRFSEQIETANAETMVAMAVKTANQLDNPLMAERMLARPVQHKRSIVSDAHLRPAPGLDA